MSYGHIKLSRKLFESDTWWREEREFSRFEAWVDMLQLAAWKPMTLEYLGEPIAIGRGEFILSIRLGSRRWGWTPKKTRGFLQRAQERARIRAQGETPAGTRYLIVNYDTYQSSREPKGITEGTPEGIDKGKERAQEGHSEGTARAQEKAYYNYSLPVQRFLAALPDDQQRRGWQASIDGWFNGLGFSGGRAAHPDDVDVGLTEYLADQTDRSFRPTHVRAYVLKAEKRRLDAAGTPAQGPYFSPEDIHNGYK